MQFRGLQNGLNSVEYSPRDLLARRTRESNEAYNMRSPAEGRGVGKPEPIKSPKMQFDEPERDPSVKKNHRRRIFDDEDHIPRDASTQRKPEAVKAEEPSGRQNFTPQKPVKILQLNSSPKSKDEGERASNAYSLPFHQNFFPKQNIAQEQPQTRHHAMNSAQKVFAPRPSIDHQQIAKRESGNHLNRQESRPVFAEPMPSSSPLNEINPNKPHDMWNGPRQIASEPLGFVPSGQWPQRANSVEKVLNFSGGEFENKEKISKLERELNEVSGILAARQSELRDLEAVASGTNQNSDSLLSRAIKLSRKLKMQEAELKDLKISYTLLKEETEKQRHDLAKFEGSEGLGSVPRTKEELIKQNELIKSKIAQIQKEYDKKLYDKTLEIEKKARFRMHKIAIEIAMKHLDPNDKEMASLIASVRELEKENDQLEAENPAEASFYLA